MRYLKMRSTNGRSRGFTLIASLMLMLLIEGVIRRDIKQEIKERVYQAAFVFLMLFAAVVIYNDVIKKLHG